MSTPSTRLAGLLLALGLAAPLPLAAQAAVGEGETASEDPAPASEDPAPASEDPAPASEDPAPASEDPAPASEDPAPASEDAVPASVGDAEASSAPPTAAVVGDGSAPADEAELQAWREASDRFRARAQEFSTVVGEIVRRRYEAQAADLRAGYDRLVTEAESSEKEMRALAIEAHEKFIKEHPDTQYTPRRMFRLAELYFETAEDKFVADNEEYYEISDKFDRGEIAYLPEPPKKDYRKPLGLYKKIIKKFPDWKDVGAAYYGMGYIYSDELSSVEDAEKATKAYLELIEKAPDSAFRAQAQFRLGDLYFEENQLDISLYYYEQILKDLEGIPEEELSKQQAWLQEKSLYKVAWARYKRNDLTIAIDLFQQLIEWAERKEQRDGKVADLKPEAIRYLAISLADRADELSLDVELHPVDFARRVLSKVPPDENGDEPKWVYEVYRELADVLRDQAKFEFAIDAYRNLQDNYPLSPDGPVFQNEIIQLYAQLPIPDHEASQQARIDLTERYGLDSEWMAANVDNSEAKATAEKFILESLKWVAFTFHEKANQSDAPEDYLLAASKYDEYLRRFPFDKEAYLLQFYKAECIYYSGDLRAAIPEYEALFGYPETEHTVDARMAILSSYHDLWLEEEPPVTDNPIALENIKPPLGEKVEFQVGKVSELTAQYLTAIHEFEAVAPDHEGIPTVKFDEARIAYFNNDFDKARALFEEIIQRWPERDDAAWASTYIVNSYLYTADLEEMTKQVERFLGMTLGADEELRQLQRDSYASLARNSLFKQGELAYTAEDYDKAVTKFEEYFEKYGDEGTDKDPKNIDLVVYNIAQGYSKLGNTKRSNDYFELLLQRFPHSPQAPTTFWKMAGNFERVLQLDKAVRYYEDLLKYHPDDPDIANALYNAAFLKIGLGRFTEAARDFERYHKEFPDLEDAKDQLFRAAGLYERQDDLRNAKRVYKEWLQKYGNDNANQWVEVQKKIADISIKQGGRRNTQEAEKILTLLSESYLPTETDAGLRDRLVQENSSGDGGLGVRIIAELNFKPLQEQYDEYAKLQFTGDLEKDKEILLRKAEWNKSLVADLQQYVLNYPDLEWQSAALYYQGLAFKNHAESWVNAPIPKELEDDPDQWEVYEIYVETLQTKADPLFKKSVELFQQVVDIARQKKRHNPWVDAALSEMSKVDPDAYPEVKPERSTVMESDAYELPFIDELPEPEKTSELDTAPADTRLASAE